MKLEIKDTANLVKEKVHFELGSFYESADIMLSETKWCRSENVVFTGCGRDALCAIMWELEKGSGKIDTVWLPSYYCHTITSLLNERYNISIYEARPNYKSRITKELTKGDAVVLLEYFGHKAKFEYSGSPKLILDKTHDPVSNHEYDFTIDFIFGSLRKVLPIPDGGFYYNCTKSLAGNEWDITDNHKRSYELISSSMKLKYKFIKQVHGDKDEFLKLHNLGESRIGSEIIPSGMISERNVVENSDLLYYLQARRSNNEYLKSLLDAQGLKLKIFDSYNYFIIIFESQSERDLMREYLIKNDIYPAILWPAEKKFMLQADLAFSSQTLVLPTDFRYDKLGMEFIVNVIEKAFK